MAEPINPRFRSSAQVVMPRPSTRHQIEVTYSGDLESCLKFVQKIGDGYGFNVELRVAHEIDGDSAEVTVRSALSGNFAQTLENLTGLQEFAVELGLYVD